MDKLKVWWRAAPEWQRRSVIGAAGAFAGFLVGLAL